MGPRVRRRPVRSLACEPAAGANDDEAALGADYAAMRAVNTEMWKTVFSKDVQIVEGMQLGRSAPGYDGGKFSAVMDGSTRHFHKSMVKELGTRGPKPQTS